MAPRRQFTQSQLIEKNREKVKQWRKSCQLYLQSRKDGPCVDCGVQYPYYVMDLDHVRGEKAFALSKSYASPKSRARIDAEIDKCDLVCANCHRERTFQRSSNR